MRRVLCAHGDKGGIAVAQPRSTTAAQEAVLDFMRRASPRRAVCRRVT
jgi:hypothetical protein